MVMMMMETDKYAACELRCNTIHIQRKADKASTLLNFSYEREFRESLIKLKRLQNEKVQALHFDRMCDAILAPDPPPIKVRYKFREGGKALLDSYKSKA